ncbi:methionyl-tRNA formyltransferase [Prolixibacter bellariivorans]|uniref:Methionyl-tRNA formyltransferase n=1 Tax=Prolixibacter bellariivorans TaxID=314319 RepID=A0A5M4AWA6_9BACT|nr:methionyl-tRNA formyltransferase [Prolixibacter bellariivorans]GET32202.1 methionyl-tRNA formyltransferase [Prolixibacter bellariivorans]
MQGKDIRIVFMGTPDFAVESLKALIENGYNVVGVVTTPDKPSGRGQKMHMSAVKQYSMSQNIPVLQPEKLKDPVFIDELKSLNADLQVIVAFRMLPEIVWGMPSMGTFNLHASLLPQYRGAAPLNWAVINGETESGVSTFLLKHEIDTGNILFQEKVPIGPDETVGDLHDKLMEVGAQLVMRTVDALAEGTAKGIAQDVLIARGAAVKPAPKIFKDDCRIDWSKPGTQIHNLIRGLSPYPASWTVFRENDGEKEIPIKIYRARFEKHDDVATPGTVIVPNRKELKIACQDGFVSITELQMAGKKRMNIADFLRGFQNAEQFHAI